MLTKPEYRRLKTHIESVKEATLRLKDKRSDLAPEFYQGLRWAYENVLTILSLYVDSEDEND